MEQPIIANGGLQYVPQIAVQYVLLDFDGELTSYNGEILTVDNVEVKDSSLTEERIANIVAELNAKYAAQYVLFVTQRPQTAEYSTIFIGKTEAFSPYGNFAGLAETIDKGNQNSTDKAFVLLDSTASDEQIISTISHETDHLLGTLDHGGEGLNSYAYRISVNSGETFNGLHVSAVYLYISSGGVVSNTLLSGTSNPNTWTDPDPGPGVFPSTPQTYPQMIICSGGKAFNTTVYEGTMFISSGGTHLGSLYIEPWSYAKVSACTGGRIDFTLANQAPDDDYLINNLSKISGSPEYTITVSAEMAEGIYKLAQGAKNFTGAITICDKSSIYGTVTVNGSILYHNEIGYLLCQADGNLTLRIGRDFTPPEFVVTGNPVNWTNQDVVLFASTNETCTIEYKVGDNDEWHSYTEAGVLISSNTIVNFKATDLSGNVTEKSIIVDKIDKIAAELEITGNPMSWTNQDVVLFASTNETCTIEYKVNNGEWQLYTNTGALISANAVVNFKATDPAGNIAEKSIVVDKIDKIASELKITGNPVNWTNQDVVLFASTNETCTIEYKVGDNDEWHSYTEAGVLISSNTIVNFKATDLSGNVTEKSIIVDKIDKIAAELEITGNPMSWTNQDVVLFASTNETCTIEYKVNNGEWQLYTNTGALISANAVVNFKATDPAGNITEKSIVVDKIVTELKITGNPVNWTNQNVVLFASTNETCTIEYKVDNGEWQLYTNTGALISANAVVNFRATNQLGTVTEKSVVVDKIDKTAPVIAVTCDNSDLYSEKVFLTAEVHESNLKSIEYSLDNVLWHTYTLPVEIKSNGIVYFKAIDSAGNSSYANFNVNNIGEAPIKIFSSGTIVFKGEEVTSAILNSGANDVMQISSGGIAYQTDIKRNATMHIFSGGVANNTLINYSGQINVSSGGIANNTLISNNIIGIPAGGTLNVLSGGIVNSITTSGGQINVFSGGKVINGFIEGRLSKDLRGRAVVIAGDVYIYDTGKVESTTVSTRGFLHVLNGGNFVKGNIVSNGFAYISSGGKADNICIESTGNLYIFQGGNVTDLHIECGGRLGGFSFAEDKQFAEILDGSALISNQVSIVDSQMNIASNGKAANITMHDGTMIIESGGNAENTTKTHGLMRILKGGSASNTTVFGGPIYVSGIAHNTTVHGGTVFVETDGVLTNGTVDSSGFVYVISGQASHIIISSGGSMYVAGGYASDIIVEEGASWRFAVGYSCQSVSWKYKGKPFKVKNGIFSSTFFEYGSAIVGGAGRTIDIGVGSAATVIVYSGGAAYNTNMAGGTLRIYHDALAEIMYSPWSHGEIFCYNSDYRTIPIESANVKYLKRDADVYYGNFDFGVVAKYNSATDLKIDAGFSAIVYSEGVIRNTTIHSGGMLEIYSGGYLRNELQIANDAVVSAYKGSIIDFTVSDRIIDDGCLINNLSLVKGAPTYTITVSASQVSGTYKLAQGAEAFTGSVTIGDGTTTYGLITVNSEDFVYNNKIYCLDQVEGNLTLTITEVDLIPPEKPIAIPSTTDPTNVDVTVSVTYSADSIVKQYKIGENGAWVDYTQSFAVRNNDTIYFRAEDAAGNVSTSSLVVTNIDKTAPIQPLASADITAVTNKDVTITATFSEDSVIKHYKIGDGEWQNYVGAFSVSENGTIYFRAEDAAGNESSNELVISNIDKTSPAIPGGFNETISGYNATLDWSNASDTGVFGVKGYYVRYGTSELLTGEGEFIAVSEFDLTDLAVGTYFYQVKTEDKAGNISEWSAIQSFEIVPGAVQNLRGDSNGLSWDAIPGVESYIVEYSTDNFAHVISFEIGSNKVDFHALPAGTYQWRVKAVDSNSISNGENIISQLAVTKPKEFVSNADGNTDVFFANASGKWGSGYAAQHTGILNGWSGTNELFTLAGKNKLADIFEGSSDANILVMTDDANGDALFLDDIYTALPGTVAEQQARIAKIDEIRAGLGDDIVDMTSQRFAYIGDGVKIYGGLGNDTIWANNGSNSLFGDAGNDRLVGGSDDNIIIGGSGNDSMYGGGGDDIFTFGNNWGNDTIEQLDGGEITLWFESGEMSNWNADTLTYSDGTNSVKVCGVSNDNITLIFGDDGSLRYDELATIGCFDDAASEKIFEDKNKGMLA